MRHGKLLFCDVGWITVYDGHDRAMKPRGYDVISIANAQYSNFSCLF